MPALPWHHFLALAATLMLAGGSYVAAPWLLPARIDEGPLVQATSTSGATLVWYTTRPIACTLSYGYDRPELAAEVTSSGLRHAARLSGLEAERRVGYVIRAGARELFRGALRTDKAAGQAFSFLVFGDSGRGSREQYLLAARMRTMTPAPDFLVHTGDLIYPDGARRRYRGRFFAPYRESLAEMPFWPSLGNHDVDDGHTPGYREIFELPVNGPPSQPAENNYWFDYADARFVVLDSNVAEAVLRDELAPWVRAAFQNAPPWRFAVLHHPPYTAGKYEPDLSVRRTLSPVFEEAGVTLVFNGHDHMYQRSHPLRGDRPVTDGAGVVYVVSGAGGARLYTPKARDAAPPEIAVVNNDRHSFTHVQISGDVLRLRQVDLDGATLDEATLRRPADATKTDP